MTGLDLSRLTETLGELPKKTPKKITKQPILEFIQNGTHGWDMLPNESPRDAWDRKIGPRNKQCIGEGDIDHALKEAYRIRTAEGCKLTFEDKLRISHGCFIECAWNKRTHTEEQSFTETGHSFDPNMRVFGKIQNSLWRYGYDRDWNTAAAAFNQIRNFNVPGFEIRLDWAIGWNEKGYAAYNRNVFLDGPLAYLLHHKGKHVLTVSFAFLKGKKIAITQIQLAQKKGNRFLFGFDRKTEILKAFKAAFKGFSIWMITGPSAVATIEKSITSVLSERERYLKNSSDEEKPRILESYKEWEKKKDQLPTELAPRLLDFYPKEEGKTLRAGGYVFARAKRSA